MSQYRASVAASAASRTHVTSPMGTAPSQALLSNILYPPSNKKPGKPEKVVPAEQELHKGWLENVRNEKRSMIK